MLPIDLRQAAKNKNYQLLREWFNSYPDISIVKLAEATGVSIGFITYWKRLIKPIERVHDPKIWDNKEWLTEHYKRHGTCMLERMTGTSFSVIAKKLAKYGIKERGTPTLSNPCKNIEWLMYHYATKEEYLKWAKIEGIEPDPNGGMELPARQCAEIAGVSTMSIIKWITQVNNCNRHVINHRDPHQVRRKNLRPLIPPTPPIPPLVTHEFTVNRAISVIKKIAERQSAGRYQDKTE